MSKTDILENLFVFTDNRNPEKLPMAFWKMCGEISAKKKLLLPKKKSHHIYNKAVPSKCIMLVGSVQGIHWPDGEYITGPSLIRQAILQYVFGQDHIISFKGRGRNEKGTANSSGEEIALNVYIILFTSSPFILFCEKVFHSLSPCIFCYSLQQLKCLLKQLQQELFKLYRHTILRQQFINTSHCWDTYRKQNTTRNLLNYYIMHFVALSH